MPKRADSGTPRFSTPQTNMDISSSQHCNKSGHIHGISISMAVLLNVIASTV